MKNCIWCNGDCKLNCAAKINNMKRQFRHRQSNDVVESTGDGFYKSIFISDPCDVPLMYIENTNDWVEIKKPEYTILTLWAKSSTPNKYKNDRVLASYDNAEIGSYDRPLCKTYPTREKWLTYFHQPLWNIHSVRRESDGLILTVGDNTPTGIIKSFILKEGTVGYASGEHTSWVGLKVWRKIEKLFTTEDGVDIYEGKEVFVIHPTTLNTIVGITTIEYSSYKGWLFFSTEQALEEYILMNKPCLSINDVANIYVSANRFFEDKPNSQANQLRNLVKTKL